MGNHTGKIAEERPARENLIRKKQSCVLETACAELKLRLCVGNVGEDPEEVGTGIIW